MLKGAKDLARTVIRPKLDLITSLYLGLVILCGIVYTCFNLTPSSYGIVLSNIGATEEGPILGSAHAIRADEWAGSTAFFQVAVRNGFQRVNATSFYQEDLRNFYLLPLKDWSLVFKPEIWAFFITSPATAFSLYYSLVMCAFLSGYFLLFRQIGMDPLVSALVSVIIYFSGSVQFWWTSFGSLEAGLPWILLLLLAPMRWWVKALLLSWLMPVVVFSFVYPALLAQFAFVGIALIVVFQPSLFRSPKDLGALAIAGLVTGAAVYFYFRDLIPIMQNTWYPGRRVGPPGTTPFTVVLSQIYPFLNFSVGNYWNFSGLNICESGTLGSFLPLLTLSLFSPKVFRGNRSLLKGMIVLLAAIALIITWQVTPVPLWIGRLLLWDRSNAERLSFICGLLITVTSLLLWRNNALSPSPFRIAAFVVLGPILSLVLKMAVFHLGLRSVPYDIVLTALGVGAGVVACLAPAAARIPFLLATVALMNVFAFGRFNPLQSAEPIFQVPETETVRQLRETEALTPGHFLLEPRFFGASLNGMGFRSVNHTLMAPSLAVFRQYFPTMDPARFDYVFNRYGHINVTEDPFPQVTDLILISVPAQAFAPVRNARTVSVEVAPHKDCALAPQPTFGNDTVNAKASNPATIGRGGAIERVVPQGNQLTIEGWAPWKGESETQGLRVISARPLRAGPLHTVKRPDISESQLDYAYTRSGFQLQVSSVDGRPLKPEEIVLVATGTSHGLVQLPGCGCP